MHLAICCAFTNIITSNISRFAQLKESVLIVVYRLQNCCNSCADELTLSLAYTKNNKSGPSSIETPNLQSFQSKSHRAIWLWSVEAIMALNKENNRLCNLIWLFCCYWQKQKLLCRRPIIIIAQWRKSRKSITKFENKDSRSNHIVEALTQWIS